MNLFPVTKLSLFWKRYCPPHQSVSTAQHSQSFHDVAFMNMSRETIGARYLCVYRRVATGTSNGYYVAGLRKLHTRACLIASSTDLHRQAAGRLRRGRPFSLVRPPVVPSGRSRFRKQRDSNTNDDITSSKKRRRRTKFSQSMLRRTSSYTMQVVLAATSC